ncbi:MAG: penicillin acylase family protein [Pseudomonadota bacterium]
MIWFKRVLWSVLLLILLAAAFIAFYIYRTFPALDGDLRAAGLQAPVSVARDGADVTHIKAQSPHDAWFSLGYVHAQERGWQLEFNRRVMHGELSEAFGPATLETDKLLRTLGIMRAAEQQWQKLPPEGKAALQAYSDGISAFYAVSSQALSPEFHILRLKPGGASGKPWTPQDAIGWSLMMALDLGGNWGTEFARLTAAKSVNTATLWQLFPPYPGEQPASKTDFSKLYAGLDIYRKAIPDPAAVKTSAGDLNSAMVAMAGGINDWARGLGIVDGKGSNSWVVAGARTASGKPLLANDPHLGLSAPAIWYFARLSAPAGKAGDSSVSAPIDAMGATLPGLPFVVLGRTSKAAWTFTNTAPDVQDLYLEQINPANPRQYRVPAPGGAMAWEDFKTRDESIKVKGEADVLLTVRETRHGPVLSDAQKPHAELLDTKRFVLALGWGALEADNQTILAGLRANQAQSVDEVLAAFSAYHSPMQNLVTADVSGQMAFKAIGKVPLRKPENDILGLAPSPGWEARYDWAGWLPYAQTPETRRSAIEAKGWLATANQRITPPGYPFFMGQDWTVPYRHDRIDQLLAARPKHDRASMQAVQADVLSPATIRLLPFLQKSVQQAAASPLTDQVRRAMQGFDGSMRAGEAAPLVFAAWADELTRGVLGGKLGKDLFGTLYGKRHFRSTIEAIMEADDVAWCGIAGCAAQSTAALERALNRLQAEYGSDIGQWTWGRAHQALSAHRPFASVPLFARYFDVKVPSGGDTFTVNVGQYWSVDGKTAFTSRQAASMRAVYDMADLENSRFIYQTGQSGLVFSSRYRDMRDTWAEVGYRPLQMNPASMAHQLTLVP